MSEEAFQREMSSFIFYENEVFSCESAVLNQEKRDPQPESLNSKNLITYSQFKFLRILRTHLLLRNKKLNSRPLTFSSCQQG